MTIKSYAPRTRQFDERPITRLQESFRAGMYSDLPASNVPETGVVHLKNMINYGDRLTGRYGSKRWGDYSTSTAGAELPVIWGVLSTFTASLSGDVRTITLIDMGPSTYPLGAADVGRFFRVGDAGWEEITEIVDTHTFKTLSLTKKEVSSGENGNFRHKLNGCFFHNRLKKIIIHLGPVLYVSDLHISSWTEINPGTVDKISDSKSTFDEYNNDLFVFNESGIYKMNLTEDLIFYHKINAINPEYGPQTNSVNPEWPSPMMRNYLYTLTKYSNDKETVRNKLNSFPVIETGSNWFNDNGGDYWTARDSLYDPGEDPDVVVSPNIFTDWEMCVPFHEIDGKNVFESQFDTYTVYSSKNIGKGTTNILSGEGNSPDLFIYSDDIPVCSPVKLKVTGFVGSTPMRMVVDVIEGQISSFDKKSRFNVKTTVDIGEGQRKYINFTALVWDVNGNSLEIIDPYAMLPPEINVDDELVGAVGFADTAVVNISSGFVGLSFNNDNYLKYCTGADGTIYTTESTLHLQGFKWFGFPENIVAGSRLTLADGSFVHVKTRVSNSMLLIHETFEESQSEVIVGFPLYKKYDSGTSDWIDLTDQELREKNSRTYFDTVTETTLSSRTRAFPLQSRFFKELPNSSIGKLVPGFVMCSNPGDNVVNYCAIGEGFEYLIGYHHPTYQFINIKDSFVGFADIPDNLVVFGRNNTFTIPLNIVEERTDEEVAAIVQVISGITTADKNIGAYSQSGIQELEKGKLVVVTNEPGIRIFDGGGYSSSISSMRVSKILQKIKSSVVAVYSLLTGFVFWMDE